ncbi:MAG: DCN1-like protein [Terriglobus roseus]|nr:DCN1-like protein [Terriglobus roseus]
MSTRIHTFEASLLLYTLQRQTRLTLALCFSLSSAASTDSQRAFVAGRKSSIAAPASRDVFKRVYKHTFKLFLQPPARSLDVDTAVALWSVLFAPGGGGGLRWQSPDGRADWFALWADFMRTRNKRPVNRDVWDQTLAFAEKTLEHGGVGFWSEDGAWPGVIDEFALWVKSEVPGADKVDAMDTA